MPRPNGRLTLEERREVLERDDYLCQVCGGGGKKSDLILEVDHINGNGKDHRPENLQTLCRHCHNVKHPWRFNVAKYRVYTFSDLRRKRETA